MGCSIKFSASGFVLRSLIHTDLSFVQSDHSRLRVNRDGNMSYQDGGTEEESTDRDYILEGRTIQGQVKTWCKGIFQDSLRKTPEMTDAYSELVVFCGHIGAWLNFYQRVIIQWLTETDTDPQSNMRKSLGNAFWFTQPRISFTREWHNNQWVGLLSLTNIFKIIPHRHLHNHQSIENTSLGLPSRALPGSVKLTL